MNIKFIDLFAGMGGFRLGFEQAAKQLNISAECVFSSEIKPHALSVYQANFGNDCMHGDITQISANQIPDFDVLLAGFPCQAFSNAGKRLGFADTRGTMFFEVERILATKQPQAFILENVEGLVTHDRINKEPIGRTLTIMLQKLNELGYQTTWNVFDASEFGLAQIRKRVFIIGTKKQKISLNGFHKKQTVLREILEQGKPTLNTKLTRLLLSHFKLPELYGKSIKDKRGGENNIHSWDIELKGSVSDKQKQLLQAIMKARRNKKWGEQKGIKWMDGMPLTLEEINTFFQHDDLKAMLDDLVAKNYVKLEHPKDVVQKQDENGNIREVREYRTDLEKGYNIVAGKLSYEINKILDPEHLTPTLVATDLDRVVVPDGDGLRTLTDIEQKRLFGFPDNFKLPITPKLAHDLFGNTVPVPVVTEISKRLLSVLTQQPFKQDFKQSETPIISEQFKLAL